MEAIGMEERSDVERSYLEAVSFAVRNVAATFREQPESFLFEADVHALLFARLFDRLAGFPVTWAPEKKGLPGFLDRTALRLNPVKMEYPGDQLFDIAVLGLETSPKEMAWTQPVRVGVELKLWQADTKTGYHFDNDKRKLEAYAAKAFSEGRHFTGLCVAFCHHRSDWRFDQWGASANGRDDEAIMELPVHGVRTLVIAAPP
jgi:hypothetical protein